MQVLKGVQHTFVAQFGISRIGKTVTVSILDVSGNVVGSGYTSASVVELSDGVYGVAITFSSTMVGYLKWADAEDGYELYEPILVISDYRDDITAIKKVELNRWKISSNQLTIYDDDDATPLYVFDLKKAGSANGNEPDERVPV